jgi:trehalose 6-phosphate phosphatase
LDFDGTLAPIVPDPADSRLLPGALDVLIRLADKGAQIAIITGREAETVIQLGGLQPVRGILVAGLYGLESWRDGVVHRPDQPDAIRQLRARLPDVVAQRSDPGVWIEDKELSLVVHTRPARDPARALGALREPVEQLAHELGLEVHAGRDVLELRPPGYDKARALRELIATVQPTGLLFAGDDLGDLPAFAAARAARQDGIAAWAVGVVSDEVPQLSDHVDVRLASPNELLSLLAEIAS